MRVARWTFALAMAAVLAGGCLDADRPEIRVENHLPFPIDVTLINADGGSIVLGRAVQPGLVMVSNMINGDQCLDAHLVATLASGQPVGTFAGPVCDGMVWDLTVAIPSTE